MATMSSRRCQQRMTVAMVMVLGVSSKTVTISNIKPRLSTTGEIVNAHDGTVRCERDRERERLKIVTVIDFHHKKNLIVQPLIEVFIIESE